MCDIEGEFELKYLCLCYYNTKTYAELSPAQVEAIGPECQPHDEALIASGKKILVGSITDPASRKCIRPIEGIPSVSNGSFHQSDEQVGAFFIVEAESLDDAVEIASLHPSGRLGKFFGGGIEVSLCEHYEPT